MSLDEIKNEIEEIEIIEEKLKIWEKVRDRNFAKHNIEFVTSVKVLVNPLCVELLDSERSIDLIQKDLASFINSEKFIKEVLAEIINSYQKEIDARKNKLLELVKGI